MARAHPQDKRARILAGALKVLAAKGFYNTKVSEIAREAGVADGTIYNYFRSKDDILISLFEDRMDWILHRLEEELAGDVVAQVTRYIELHLSLAAVEPDLAEFITVELRQSEKFVREYKNPWFTDYLRVLANLIERGQREGVFAAGLDPRIASRAIFGALDEILLTLTWKHSGALDVATTVEQVTKLVLRGLMRREGDD